VVSSAYPSIEQPVERGAVGAELAAQVHRLGGGVEVPPETGLPAQLTARQAAAVGQRGAYPLLRVRFESSGNTGNYLNSHHLQTARLLLLRARLRALYTRNFHSMGGFSPVTSVTGYVV
jgi:hypothetical protein